MTQLKAKFDEYPYYLTAWKQTEHSSKIDILGSHSIKENIAFNITQQPKMKLPGSGTAPLPSSPHPVPRPSFTAASQVSAGPWQVLSPVRATVYVGWRRAGVRPSDRTRELASFVPNTKSLISSRPKAKNTDLRAGGLQELLWGNPKVQYSLVEEMSIMFQ